MSITSISSSTAQSLWEELRQETMRNTEKTVTASNGQEVSVISIDPDDLDGDGVVTLMERENAARKNITASPFASAAVAAEASLSPSSVSTDLENVGPNTYERIKANAGKTYRSQSMTGYGSGPGITSGEEAEASSLQGLNRSA